MTTQTTGLEFKRFYADPSFWPGDGETYHDDTLVIVNGNPMNNEDDLTQIPDDAIVRIESGYVEGVPAALTLSKVRDMGLDEYFELWRARQAAEPTKQLLVECPPELTDSLIALIEQAGGKIIGGGAPA